MSMQLQTVHMAELASVWEPATDDIANWSSDYMSKTMKPTRHMDSISEEYMQYASNNYF